MKTANDIKLCDGKYSIGNYAHGWCVRQHYIGKDKDGNPKARYHETYHASVHQCCKYILDKLASDCEDAAEIKRLFENAADIVTEKAERKIDEAKGGNGDITGE